jgi:hypothetical protein
MPFCAFCDKPLICDACNADFQPASEDQYHDLHSTDRPVFCPECEQLLICHWCKTPYDGKSSTDE